MGRTNTVFKTSDGQMVVPGTLNRQLREFPIPQYQVEQVDQGVFIFRYVAASASGSVQVAADKILRERLGNVEVQYEAVDTLGETGKKSQAFLSRI